MPTPDDRARIAGLIEFYGVLIEGGAISRPAAEMRLIDAGIGLTGYGARVQLTAWRTARTRYNTGGAR